MYVTDRCRVVVQYDASRGPVPDQPDERYGEPTQRRGEDRTSEIRGRYCSSTRSTSMSLSKFCCDMPMYARWMLDCEGGFFSGIKAMEAYFLARKKRMCEREKRLL